MELENKNVLVYGMGKSGESAKALLLLHKANVFCFDDNIESEEFVKNKTDKKFISSLDICVVSPSISIYNKYLKKLKRNKVKIITEVELGAMFCNSKLITVTGTDGKTTTVTLLNEVLNKTNNSSCAVGNIGYPITQFVCEKNNTKYAVCELSSFMLEFKPNLNPIINVVLNVSSDHLNRHKFLKNYVKSKQNAVKMLNNTSYCVLNHDNKHTKNMQKLTKAQVFFISLKTKVKGCYVENNTIYFNNGVKKFKIMQVKNIKLLGKHNLYNVLACICVCLILGVNVKKMIQAVSNFQPLPHRTQYVNSINNVKFYNDSKSTTIQSCLSAVSCFQNNLVLILGGRNKGLNLKTLCTQLIKKVNHIVLIGETSYQIKDILERLKFKNYTFGYTLTNSVKKAYQIATALEGNSNVLFSPACASFDMFSSYAERGEKFINEVEKLKNEQKI